MKITTKNTLFVATLLVLSLFSFATPIDAQVDSQALLMTNMRIHAELGTDCDTTIILETGFTNVGSAEISSFDLRIDVRGLQVNEATINGASVESIVHSIDNYVVISISSNIAILAGSQGNLFLNFTTQCLQERIGVNVEGSMYVNHLIYYFRPLNEIQNLTFSAALPQHAVIDLDSAAPLYPSPTSNHTDGRRTIYVWQTDVLLPGQEIVYIVKYQIPVAVVDTFTEEASNSMALGIAAVVIAVLAVLIVERIPGWIKRFKSHEIIVSGKISTQEQEILDLLSIRGGSCPQREIYEDLDMSQSMASMMLTSLEGRGLIKRLRSGRENIVHIMEED